MFPRSVGEALKSLEKVTLKYGYLSCPLDRVGQDNEVRKRWLAIAAYFAFMVRGLILTTHPISCPAQPIVCLVLGDHVSMLGYPVRQMWNGLAFIYSAFCIYNITILTSGARRNKLKFMTDFAPRNSRIVEASLQADGLWFRILLTGYHMGFLSCVASCYAALLISFLLESIHHQDVLRMICSCFWMIYNMVWATYTVSVVHFLLYIWLSGEVVASKLRQAERHARLSIQQKGPLDSTLELVYCLKLVIKAADQTNTHNQTMNEFIQGVYYGFMLSSATALMVLFSGGFANIFVFGIIAILVVTQVLFIFSIVHIATIPTRASKNLIPLLYSALCRQQSLPVRFRRQGLQMLELMTNPRTEIAFTCGQHFPMSTESMAAFTREVILNVMLLLTVI